MPTSSTRPLTLGLLTLALFYAAFWDSGFTLLHWYIALLFLAAAVLVRYRSLDRDRLAPALPRWALWSALLLPCYVLLQLFPWPVLLLKLLSPARAQSLEALRTVMAPVYFSALSTVPADTWEHLIRLLAYLGVLFVVRQLAWRNSARAWGLAVPILVLATLEAALGLWQLEHASGPITGVVRRGTYPNRNHFAALLEMALPFAAMAIVAAIRKSPGEKGVRFRDVVIAACAFGAGLLMLVGITSSLSRIGLVACMASLLIMGLAAIPRHLPPWVKGLVFAGAALAGLAAMFSFAPLELIKRYAGTDNAEPRGAIWKDTLHLIAQYPVFGTGLGTFGDVFYKYQTGDVNRAYVFAHNDYLQLLGELGLVGFGGLAVLTISILLMARAAIGGQAGRQRRYLGLACVGAIAALLIHSFFDFNLYVPANAMVFAWILGIASSLGSKEGKSGLSPRAFRVAMLATGGILAVYASLWLVFDWKLRSNETAERLLCKVGICDNAGQWQRAQRQSAEPRSLAVATASFEEALRRNPNAPFVWCDMGMIQQLHGRSDKAKYCYARAYDLAPNLPVVLWRLAGAEASLSDMPKAHRYAKQILAESRLFDLTLFTFFTGMRTPAATFADEILPPSGPAARSYLAYLMKQGAIDDAGVVWEWALPKNYIDAAAAKDYTSFLVNHNRGPAAAASWVSFQGNRAGEFPKSNAVFNGDFENEPRGGIFDWTIQPNGGMRIAFDPAVKFSGARSLQVCFDRETNTDFQRQVSQVFAVSPGAYRLDAYIKTENLSSGAGLQWRINAWPKATAWNVKTPPVSGSTPWKKVSATFTIPAGVTVAALDLIRPPLPIYDHKLGGCAWVDQVRVSRAR